MAENKKGDVVVNLDTLGVPIAIIVAGVIIASVIFFTSKNSPTVKGDTNNDNNIADDSGVSGGDVVVSLGDDPFIGDKSSAKVAIVDFSDYQCGYCQRHATETFPEVKKNFVDTGKILYVFKEYPLSSEGQIGFTTAHAGMCVFELGGTDKYVSFHKDAFFKKSDSEVRSLAVGLGVDGGKYDSCMSEKKFVSEINADRKEGSDAGISGTPGFIVGLIDESGNVRGKLIAGAYPYATFEKAINDLLK